MEGHPNTVRDVDQPDETHSEASSGSAPAGAAGQGQGQQDPPQATWKPPSFWSLHRKSILTVAVHMLYLWATAAIILFSMYATGTSDETALDTDAKLGATVYFVALLCTLLFLFVDVRVYGEVAKDHSMAQGSKIYNFVVGSLLLWAMVCTAVSVVLTLLGARIHALTQLRAMPVLAVACNEDMARVAAAGAMPGRVLVPDAAQFEVVSAGAQSALDAAVWYVIVNATSPALCAAGGAVSLAVSLRGNTPLSEVPWPPRALANGSSAYFATAPDVRYFAGNPEGARDRAWYRSALWTERGIPLIAPEPVPPVATKLAQYERARNVILICCAAVLVLPLLILQPHDVGSSLSFLTCAVVHTLVMNPLTMLIFGAVCHAGDYEVCMMSRTSAIALIVTGSIFTALWLLGVLMNACK